MNDHLFNTPNQTHEHMKDLLQATQEILDNKRRFIFAGGPAGIAKSTFSGELFNAYNDKHKAIWESFPDDEKPERRTWYDDMNRPIFRPPIKRLYRITALALYVELIQHSNYDEGLVLDDPVLITQPDVQALIMQATDSSTGNMVGWQTSKPVIARGQDGEVREWPTAFAYKGFVAVITNHSYERFVRDFAVGFRSRAYKVFFPDDMDDIATFVETMAFRAAGLYNYVLRKKPPEGVAFKGTLEEAVPILDDVYRFWLAQKHRLSEPDLRFLQQVAQLRVFDPVGWRARAMRLVR